MGKKKVSKTNPDALKEAGNKAFCQGSFEEALKLFTQAIELTEENPNHIFFANRANAHLELENFKDCIEDCDMAIKIDAKFIKSYIRKANAQINL